MAEVLTAPELERLLVGLDDAFQAVLHSRFGGGIAVFVVADGALGESQTLRTARAGTGVFLRLQLYPAKAPPGPASAPGVPVGTIRLSTPPSPQVEDVTILTEIFVDHDPNEPGDATPLTSGIVMRCMPQTGGPAGLLVVRSREAGAAHDDHDLQRQRAWRPQARRHATSGMLGAAGRSHRVSSPPGLHVPVAADLLHRIGAAVAALNRDFALVAVLVETGA